MKRIAGFTALALLAGAAALAAGDEGLLPPDGFLGAWSRHEGTRIFQGAELYGHMDGGAELFLEFGFETLTLQRYRKGPDEFLVEIYRMTDPGAALGIYLMKCGRETPDPGFAERHTVGRYQLELLKGPYYLRVTSVEGKPELQPVLLEFGRFAAAKIPAVPRQSALGLLPREGMVEGSFRVIRGPYSLQAVAGNLGEGDFLLLGGKVTAAAGDYREGGDAISTRLAAEYPSGEAASAAFHSLRERLDPLLKVQESGGGWLIFRDGGGKYGLASLEGNRVEVRFDLPSKPAPPAKEAGSRRSP